ncbi:MAG TPA: class I SAM-dependent methyltransferase [Candidatus Limnocylindria bacterium]|nr:class I SAM-dependent methyltransferase [Candidatus Limnocylindria bacterium]
MDPAPRAAGEAVDWFGVSGSTADDERLAALYDLDVQFAVVDAAIDWFRGLARMTGGPVLELGVGTGRVAIPIAKDGSEVVGIDRSTAMLARAAKHAKEQRVRLGLVEADMRTFSLDRTFPLVTIAFNTFLMLTPDERWACLARCREHMTPNGRLAIDVFQPDPNTIAGLDGGVREEWRRPDPETGHHVAKFSSTRGNVDGLTLHWWFDEELPDGGVRRITRETRMHYLYRREAELMFPAAGFEIDSLHGDYTAAAVTGSSPQLLFVLRRRERGPSRDRRRR